MGFKEIKSTEEFNNLILNSNVELVVAYFTASWCGPCKQIYPYVLNIGENNEHILALKIDIDICEELSSKYEISCMPTFKFFKNKNLSECDSFSGADSNKLINMIKTLLGNNGDNGNNQDNNQDNNKDDNGNNQDSNKDDNGNNQDNNGDNQGGGDNGNNMANMANMDYLKSIDNNPQNNTFNSNNIRCISGFSNFNNGFDNFSNF